MFQFAFTDTSAGRIVWACTKRKGWIKLNFMTWEQINGR